MAAFVVEHPTPAGRAYPEVLTTWDVIPGLMNRVDLVSKYRRELLIIQDALVREIFTIRIRHCANSTVGNYQIFEWQGSVDDNEHPVLHAAMKRAIKLGSMSPVLDLSIGTRRRDMDVHRARLWQADLAINEKLRWDIDASLPDEAQFVPKNLVLNVPRIDFRELRYDAFSAELEDTPCSICLDGESSLGCELPCEHIFHATCISDWVSTHATCPTCRAIFLTLDDDFNTKNRNYITIKSSRFLLEENCRSAKRARTSK
jgi:hypothetical protein